MFLSLGHSYSQVPFKKSKILQVDSLDKIVASVPGNLAD